MYGKQKVKPFTTGLQPLSNPEGFKGYKGGTRHTNEYRGKTPLFRRGKVAQSKKIWQARLQSRVGYPRRG